MRAQNVTVVISGPAPFAGVVLTSFQFSDRPGANLYMPGSVATNYNCSTQTGYLDVVPAGTPTVRLLVAQALLVRRLGATNHDRDLTARTHAACAQNTIAYFSAGAPLTTLTATFLLANYAESTVLKWFIQPSASTPTVWYGPFPQVVNVY